MPSPVATPVSTSSCLRLNPPLHLSHLIQSDTLLSRQVHAMNSGQFPCQNLGIPNIPVQLDNTETLMVLSSTTPLTEPSNFSNAVRHTYSIYDLCLGWKDVLLFYATTGSRCVAAGSHDGSHQCRPDFCCDS